MPSVSARMLERLQERLAGGAHLVPPPLGSLVSRLPQYPHSLLLATALNVLLAELLAGEELAALRGKVLRVYVTDAGIACSVALGERRFMARAHHARADLTITAGAGDFLLLVGAREDPDTLFFSRRLTVEGDTELGLLVKNTFERLDLRELAMTRLSLRRFLTRFTARPTR